MWEEIKNYSSENFKRLTGVSIEVFEEMLWVLEKEENAKKKKGRPSRFALEDQLLIALEYWGEYRTYFHIASSWSTHESTISRIVKRIENALISSELFHLPGKKALINADNNFEVIVVDATETPIERPKKTKALLQCKEKASYFKNSGCCR